MKKCLTCKKIIPPQQICHACHHYRPTRKRKFCSDKCQRSYPQVNSK